RLRHAERVRADDDRREQRDRDEEEQQQEADLALRLRPEELERPLERCAATGPDDRPCRSDRSGGLGLGGHPSPTLGSSRPRERSAMRLKRITLAEKTRNRP